jgi:hypothetical protein
MIGVLLILPSPRTVTSFYRWLCERIALPDGMRLNFAEKPGDIWYIFIAISAAALSWILGVHVIFVGRNPRLGG